MRSKRIHHKIHKSEGISIFETHEQKNLVELGTMHSQYMNNFLDAAENGPSVPLHGPEAGAEDVLAALLTSSADEVRSKSPTPLEHYVSNKKLYQNRLQHVHFALESDCVRFHNVYSTMAVVTPR